MKEIDIYRKTSLHLAIVFPGLPGSHGLDLEELVRIAAEKLYIYYIFFFADR